MYATNTLHTRTCTCTCTRTCHVPLFSLPLLRILMFSLLYVLLSNVGKEIAEQLKGHTPTFLNPATIVSGFIALYHACEKREEKENFVTTLPGFSAMTEWQALDQCFFSGPKKLTSSGCAACAVCGGRHNIVTPFFAAKLTVYGVKWVEWPSRSNNTVHCGGMFQKYIGQPITKELLIYPAIRGHSTRYFSLNVFMV